MGYYSNLSRILANADGIFSAMALAKGLNLGRYGVFGATKTSMNMQVSNPLTTAVTGQNGILAMLAFHKADGTFDGAMAIIPGCPLDRFFAALLQSISRSG